MYNLIIDFFYSLCKLQCVILNRAIYNVSIYVPVLNQPDAEYQIWYFIGFIILYKKKVKVEREILSAKLISFVLNNIHNYVVLYSIKICNILRIFRQLYILTSGVRET